MYRGILMCAAAGVVFIGSQALAQMPPDIAKKIAAMGRVIELDNTGKIYQPLHEKEPYAGIKVVRDVKYGTHPRQAVDIFTPESGTAARPVLMFVHGGAMSGVPSVERLTARSTRTFPCSRRDTVWLGSMWSIDWHRSSRGRRASRTWARRCGSSATTSQVMAAILVASS